MTPDDPAFDIGGPASSVRTGRVGRYEIVRRLGGGGMGEVFLARDPNVDRQVALKLLHDEFDTGHYRRRFWREARAAGKLRHPNIVTIFDVDEHEGRPFITMEYIPGPTLLEMIAKGISLPLPVKLEMLEGVCAGLGNAHEAGIAHRDIKPANLILDPNGTVKILDFGIAKGIGAELATQTRLTMQNVVIGTLGYMSPEQLSGGPVDYRTDMFGTAAVAYELLTGHRAFKGAKQDIAQKVLRGDIRSMSAFGAAVPLSIERIVRKGLAVQPEGRYRNMAAMRQAFAAARGELSRESGTVFAGLAASEIIADLISPASTVAASRVQPRIAEEPDSIAVDASGTTFDFSAEDKANKPDPIRLSTIAALVTAGLLAVGATAWLLSSHQSDQAASRSASPVLLPVPTVGSGDDGRTSPPQQRAALTRPGRNQGGGAAAGSASARSVPQSSTTLAANSDEGDNSIKPTPASSGVGVPSFRPETSAFRPETSAPQSELPTAPTDTPTLVAPRVDAPTVPPVRVVTLSPYDDEAIRAVLRQFEDAFENLSSSRLKALQPTLTKQDLDGWDHEFALDAWYRVNVEVQRISLVSPTEATVDSSITKAFKPKTGAERRTTRRVTIFLDRTSSGWQIASVRGQGWQ